MSTSDDAAVHLRAAALELIAAARAVLDLTEEMVKDPGPLLSAVTAMAAVARQAAAAQSTPEASADDRPDGAPDPDERGPSTRPKPRVQHIRVS